VEKRGIDLQGKCAWSQGPGTGNGIGRAIAILFATAAAWVAIIGECGNEPELA
jgi:hypothetical protein